MHREDGFGFWRNGFFDQLCVQAVGIRVYIHENRNSVDQKHWADGSFPGIGRNNDFVSRANPDGLQGRLNGHRSRVHALRVLGGMELGELL